MRILWVSSNQLLPTNAGGRIRSTSVLRELARRHEVQILASYRAAAPDPAYEADLAAEFPGARCFYNGPPTAWRGKSAVSRLLSPVPGVARQAQSPAVASLVRDHMDSRAFDVTVCDFLETAANYPRRLATPSVLFEHNVESDLRLRQSTYAPGRRERLELHFAARKVRSFEVQALRRFHHTVAVSHGDEQLLRALAGHDRVTAIPTGVDTATYRPSPLPADGCPVVMFTGLMAYLPNVDAVTWFCAEAWPRILAAVPSARFVIVGRRPTARVTALASASVEVTGEVQSVAGHLHRASVVVVPLRAGSGTRLKIYEAMASGRPVVSTSLGAAGLDVEHGKDIVLADDARAIASEVIALLTSPTRAATIGAAAAKSAAAHGWPTVAHEFERILEAVISPTREARAASVT